MQCARRMQELCGSIPCGSSVKRRSASPGQQLACSVAGIDRPVQVAKVRQSVHRQVVLVFFAADTESRLERAESVRTFDLNGNEKSFVGTAPCALKGAQIKTGFVRLDADQPHRCAASRAVTNSEVCNTKTWIGLSRQHVTPLKTGRERDTLSHRLLPMVGR